MHREIGVRRPWSIHSKPSGIRDPWRVPDFRGVSVADPDAPSFVDQISCFQNTRPSGGGSTPTPCFEENPIWKVSGLEYSRHQRLRV